MALPKKPTIEQLTQKTCYDNYLTKGLSQEDVFSRKVPGETDTLYMITLRDLQRKIADPAFPMHMQYYKLKRDMFRGSDHPSKKLKKNTDGDVVINPVLLKAMIAYKNQPFNNVPMQMYLGQAKGPTTQTEVIGICKWASERNPTCPKQLAALVDWMRWLARQSIRVHHAVEFGIMTETIDMALVQLRMKSKKVVAEVFSSLHSDILCLVMDKADLDKVLDSNMKYTTVEAALTTLVAQSSIGQTLWAFACLDITADKVEAVVREGVDKFQKGVMSFETLNEAKFKISNACEQVVGFARLPMKRDVNIKFKGELLPARVTSNQAYVNNSLAAASKYAGAKAGDIPGFFSEDRICPLILGGAAWGGPISIMGL